MIIVAREEQQQRPKTRDLAPIGQKGEVVAAAAMSMDTSQVIVGLRRRSAIRAWSMRMQEPMLTMRKLWSTPVKTCLWPTLDAEALE